MKTKARKPAPSPRRKVERPRQPGSPYRIEEAAAALHLAPRTVRKRIAAGELAAYKDGRLVMVSEAALAEYRAKIEGQPAARVPAKEATVRLSHRLLKPARARG